MTTESVTRGIQGLANLSWKRVFVDLGQAEGAVTDLQKLEEQNQKIESLENNTAKLLK